ncbi:unnamed protein product [Cylindrotheca closterium]|uniref:VOC domain-containing protein n=1 Tax=Cylindrotheca closterium TaxID=2856 RepID=A0AAD2GCC4_9STRA|nr:unnamed protein product [Cylindrotheca closterium]
MKSYLALFCLSLGGSQIAQGFVAPQNSGFRVSTTIKNSFDVFSEELANEESSSARRSLIHSAAAASFSLALGGAIVPAVNADVGTLPEFGDSEAIIQGLTVNVSDKSQLDGMVEFLVKGFDFQILRQRIRDTVEEIWLGYGPEQLSIPGDFEIPVSSFAKYGGHMSLKLVLDSRVMKPLYKGGDDAPGNNIDFLQVGVPGYRISQMVASGGKILDAYGLVNVVSPSGFPMRGIVGITPDPIMLVAVNCKDVKESKAFYEKLGFVEQEYPYSRPSKGTTIFEPAPPAKSVYMAPSAGCMGVLLQPTKKRITPNPAVESLNIVYNPTNGNDGDGLLLTDPSGLGIRFMSASTFTEEEKKTR